MSSDASAPLALGAERIFPDEAHIAGETRDLVKEGLIETPPGEVVRRDAHPYAHGCVHGTFTVSPDVPAAFRHGFFAEPKTYPVWVRFSNGNKGPDTKGDVRGMGIKVCQVPGEKILNDERLTQDFLLISNPVMPVGIPDEYLAFFKTAIKTNPWYALTGINPIRLVRAFRILADMLLAKPTNPLLIRYWSTTAYKMGAGAVKYSARPSASMNAGEAQRPSHPGPRFLREVMAALLEQRDASFDFMLQAQTDPVSMPIEDCSILWSEEISPFVKVGTIQIPKQQFTAPQQEAFCENLSINPWHALPDHRPLGGINRVRRVVYEAITDYRHQRNESPRIEPTGDERF